MSCHGNFHINWTSLKEITCLKKTTFSLSQRWPLSTDLTVFGSITVINKENIEQNTCYVIYSSMKKRGLESVQISHIWTVCRVFNFVLILMKFSLNCLWQGVHVDFQWISTIRYRYGFWAKLCSKTGTGWNHCQFAAVMSFCVPYSN